MSERSYAQTKNSATPSHSTQSSSPLLGQRPFTDERYDASASDSKISTEGQAQQPKIPRSRLDWRNITIEAPNRSAIQRQDDKEQQQDIQLQPEAVSIQRQETTSIEEKRAQELATSNNPTISTEGQTQQPKIARAGLNWRNISIEAPPRAVESSTYPGGIQRQQEEEQLAEAPTIQRQVSAASEEKSTEESCNSTRSTAGQAEQPKIARSRLDWRNIAIEAPSRAGVSSTYPGGIQRQQTSEVKQKEDTNESLQMQSDGAIQAKCSECESSVQTKLTVGAPGDKYEQEADNMAAKVMTMPDSVLQQPIQRQTEAEQEQLQTQPLVNSITPLVQRSPDSSTQASSSIESRLNSSKGGGSPLPNDVRSFMEPRFGADFSSIKVHSDSNAVQMNKELGAQAFAHGSDIYYGAGKSPGKNELTAHELTHTIQQGAAMRMNKEVQRQPQQEEEQVSLQAKEISSLQEDRQGLKSQSLSSSRLKPTINNIASPFQRTLAISPEIDFRAVDDSNQATPLNFESSEFRSETQGETIAAKEIPSYNPNLNQNKELRQKPQEEEQEETLDEPIQAKQFTNASPFNNKNSIQRQRLAVSSVSPRIQGDFLGIGNPIDKIKGAIAGFASRLPGYPLLTLILGKDPISDAPVQRNATNLVRGLLSLVPNGDKIFNNLQQSGALQKAFDWFNGEVAKLNLTWDAIKGLFGKALNSLGIGDALNPIGAFEKVKNVFIEPIGRIKNFAVAAGTKVMEFAFEGFLNMAGGAGAKVMGILRKAGGVFTSILKDPVGFCGNLVGAVRGGFQKFSGNVATHLKNGLTGWLFGALAGAGLTLPAQFDLKGIVSIVLQVLGATYERLRGKLANKIGEQKVSRLEKAFDFLRTIVTGGLAAAWQKISEFAGNLQEMVIGGIKEWVMNSVITAAITKLISMFNPAGAIIQAVMAIYNTVMFFIERGSQIAALAEAVFNSIGNIAAGNVAGAANYVEQTMGRSLPVMISFLARLIGLGGVSEHIKNVIKKIQAPIENAMNKLANFIVEKAKGLLGKGKEAVAGLVEWWKAKKKFTASNGEQHTLFFSGADENANLMIASQPKTYEAFIKGVDVSNKSQQMKEAKAKAQAIAQEIDKLRKKRKGKGAGVQTAEGKDIQAQVVEQLNQLADQTSILAAGTAEVPPSVIRYGSVNQDGGATGMNAEVLSKNHVPGSEPGDYPDIWMKANRRQGAYVQGHLLNHNIGGPGRSYNLTPITREANAKHHSVVEAQIKSIILGQNQDPGVIRYSVNVIYGTHPMRSSQQAIEDRLNNNTSQNQNKDREKLDIMKYEQKHLPRGLEINWAILKNEGGKWVDAQVKDNLTVPNRLPNEEPQV